MASLLVEKKENIFYAVDEACTDLSLDIKCDKLQRTMHRKGQKAGKKSD